MSVTDPIADLITRIRNAVAAKKDSISVPYSKVLHNIADVLAKTSFISRAEKEGKGVEKKLVINFSYDKGDPITGIERVSKPSRRVYAGIRDLSGFKKRGVLILSTPEGLMTDREAGDKNVGGEVLIRVW